jgi:hypothetical protein
VLAGGELAARGRHPRDRAGDRAREHERDDGGERCADERGEREAEGERPPVCRLAVGRTEQHDRLLAVAPRRVEKRCAADVERPARRRPDPELIGGRRREEKLRLGLREDREALLVGGEKAAERRLGIQLGNGVALRCDQVHLPLERLDCRAFERPSRQQRTGDDGHDERYEDGARDAEEETGSQVHGATSL